VAPSRARETFFGYRALLHDLKERFKISELHFSDIFGGAGEFAEIGWEERLSIFNTMARAFAENKYTVLVQSLEPHQLQKWKNALQLPKSISVFNFGKLQDTALFLLLLKVRVFINSNQSLETGKAHVFVDEGWKKKGVGLVSSALFSPEFDRGKVCFGSSKDLFLLQLADFAAFVLNRMQIVMGKNPVTKKERHLLQVVQPIVHLYQDVSQQKLLIHNQSGQVQPITEGKRT
jgi:hypothetical protein